MHNKDSFLRVFSFEYDDFKLFSPESQNKTISHTKSD